MQVLKETLKDRILEEAQMLFLSKGYLHASLRDIAAKAECSLSNLYNYFKNKEELFGALLEPLINDIEKGLALERERSMSSSLDIKTNTEKHSHIGTILEYADQHRDSLKLLLFKSEGSKWHDYQNHIIDNYTEHGKLYLERFYKAHPGVKPLSDIFLHNSTAFYVNTMIEMLMHDVSLEEMKRCTQEVMAFSYGGWCAILKE